MLIVKNEAHNLRACIASFADLADEIIVVDTGSTDDTVAIARKLGAKVFHFPWIDDFAAARNESLRHATGDWIFWMDADDRLDDVNRERLRRLLAAGRLDDAVAQWQQALAEQPRYAPAHYGLADVCIAGATGRAWRP